jgi:hypothetical protein
MRFDVMVNGEFLNKFISPVTTRNYEMAQQDPPVHNQINTNRTRNRSLVSVERNVNRNGAIGASLLKKGNETTHDSLRASCL